MGLKRSKSDVDHSPSSSAKVENVWRLTSTPYRIPSGYVKYNLIFLCSVDRASLYDLL